MLRRIALFAFAISACSASAATISFLPTAQTIGVGASTTVDVRVSGLSVGQVLGAFDVTVLSTSSIVTPTGVVFLGNLGNPGSELTISGVTSGSAFAAETSLETTTTLQGLQTTQPFALFRITYLGVGPGTSPLTVTTPLVLSDGAGNVLPVTASGTASITVTGNVGTVPEPSSFFLLGGTMAVFGLRRKDSRSRNG